jgi:hypothetical protein
MNVDAGTEAVRPAHSRTHGGKVEEARKHKWYQVDGSHRDSALGEAHRSRGWGLRTWAHSPQAHHAAQVWLQYWVRSATACLGSVRSFAEAAVGQARSKSTGSRCVFQDACSSRSCRWLEQAEKQHLFS